MIAQLCVISVDISMLMKYSKDAAEWSSKLRRLEFALNSSNKPDVALFDFTSMYSATNASCAKKIYLKCCGENIRKSNVSKYTLLLLCGDSLLEPVFVDCYWYRRTYRLITIWIVLAYW